MLPITLAFLAGYRWGGIPTAYLWARFRGGIDIRQHGSGNMGASNVIAHVGKGSGFALGLVDGFVKGTAPVVVANLLGYSEWVQATAALGAVVGHNWSPYMRLTGGRGIATTAGILLGFGMWPELLFGILLGGVWGGLIRKQSAVWVLVAMAMNLPLAYFLTELDIIERPTVYMTVLWSVLALMMLKRLVSNWQSPVEGVSMVRVLRYRLLFDRDIADRDEWVSRRPEV